MNATREKTSHAKACGKAIIIGEHAVVYGATAVALPLLDTGIELDVFLEPTDDENCEPDLAVTLDDGPVSDTVRSVVLEALTLLAIKAKHVRIVGRSNLPLGAGLGSSATLCVALLRAFSQIKYGQVLAEAEIARLANQLERRFHGNPSGLDTAVVSFEKIVSFRRDETPQPLKVPSTSKNHRWRFVIIDSGERSATMEMVAAARPFFSDDLGKTRLATFEALAQNLKVFLQDGNESGVGQAMNAAHALLKDIHLSTDKLDAIVSTCINSGCHGAKLTGAGGGGAVLALLPSERAAECLGRLQVAMPSSFLREITLS